MSRVFRHDSEPSIAFAPAWERLERAGRKAWR
jgi:hypothetical protein